MLIIVRNIFFTIQPPFVNCFSLLLSNYLKNSTYFESVWFQGLESYKSNSYKKYFILYTPKIVAYFRLKLSTRLEVSNYSLYVHYIIIIMYNQKCFIMAVNEHMQIRIFFIRHDYIAGVATLITFVSSHNRERKCGDFFL